MRPLATHARRPRRRMLVAAALACGLAGSLAVAVDAVLPAQAVTSASASDESKDFNFPGADTMALHNGSKQYITYGASAHGRKVPYSISGSGNIVRTSPKIKGDAMPHGAGKWATAHSGVWTPGAFYHVSNHVGRYYLFYTAVRAGTDGQHCVGVAHSRYPTRGFTPQAHPLVCPAKKNRWAIDADVTTGPHGGIWMTWRDGERAVGAESALSTMMLTFHKDGTVASGTKPRVILRSNHLPWTHFRDGGVTVIENPSAIYNHGSWYLFYSGNSWNTNYYSTGIAYCGKKLGNNPCTPMPGAKRAYFAYSGPKAHLKAGARLRSLPGNKRGPGAMDVYRARDGKPWVTWNYLTGSKGTSRKSRVGRLTITGTGRSASFKVTLR